MPQTEPLYRIKPLEWEEDERGGWVAHTYFGPVYVWWHQRGHFLAELPWESHPVRVQGAGYDEAKVYAEELWREGFGFVLERVEEEG